MRDHLSQRDFGILSKPTWRAKHETILNSSFEDVLLLLKAFKSKNIIRKTFLYMVKYIMVVFLLLL